MTDDTAKRTQNRSRKDETSGHAKRPQDTLDRGEPQPEKKVHRKTSLTKNE